MIDLHGYHVHEAWKQFTNQIDNVYYTGAKRVTVVTGQGAIMREMPTWIANNPKIKEYRQASHNPGSFTCFFVKKKVDK